MSLDRGGTRGSTDRRRRPSHDEAEREGCPSDQDLLADAGRGDRAAFATLYDRYASRLFGLILMLVRDRTVAEDVLQEVFLHIWRKAADYNPALAKPSVWMMLITRGKSIDALRRRGAMTAAVASWSSMVGTPSADPRTDTDPRTEKACKALAALPPEQSEALTLAFHGGLTSAEIALHRGVPLGTIKTRIRLGLRKLRDAFDCACEVTT
jgi:RNA polymerase sigma-70 factor, ECF subfamily